MREPPKARISDGLDFPDSGESERGLEPVEVGLAGGFEAEDQEFGGFVAMELVDAGFEGGELIGAGFEEQEGFRGGLYFVLPVVDGLNGRDECGADGEPLLDQGAGELSGFVWIGTGGEDNSSGRSVAGHGGTSLAPV